MSHYETPTYRVILKDESIELRDYQKFWIVKYTASAGRDADAAFQTLFSYIQGYNQTSEKIAMTVPVYQDIEAKVQNMSFVVPEKFIQGIPQPNHPNLHIETFEEGVYAVITFSGATKNANIEKHKKILEAWIDTKGYKTYSGVISAIYNAPFTPPFMRRNELMLHIEYTER